MADQGEGPAAPPPPYFWTKLKPKGPKKIFLETPRPYLKACQIQHCCYLYLLLIFWANIFMFHSLWLQFWLFKFCKFLWHHSFYFYLLLFSAWLFTCFSWDERKPYECQCRARCGQRIGAKKAKFAAWTEKLWRKCQGEDTCYCEIFFLIFVQ